MSSFERRLLRVRVRPQVCILLTVWLIQHEPCMSPLQVRGAGPGGAIAAYWWSNALALRAALQLSAVWEDGKA